MSELIPTIGIETHVQLLTKSKLFCSCNNDAREAAPNTLICPVCLGLPGTLPVLNHRAIELAIRAGLALNGDIAAESKFDRKNYFYPDLPKGYQITQFDQPIVGRGKVEFPLDGRIVSVGITRAHLEEDAGKLTHPDGTDYSLVDLNRAGTPLLEVVSEPDMHTAAEAKGYAQEIYNLMRYAGVSAANLYYGNMRFDVNVSLAPAGELGTRTETKNLNSFKAVERAVEYEIKRQTELIAKGQKIVQETRGWDEAKVRTFAQRSKEEAHDYRYFPEPDLPPLVVTAAMKTAAGKDLTTPANVRAQLATFGLSSHQSEVLAGDPDLSKLFLAVSKTIDGAGQVRIAGWLTGEVLRVLGVSPDLTASVFATDRVSPKNLIELSDMVAQNQLSSTAAKTVLEELMRHGGDSQKIAQRLNLIQVSDAGALDEIVEQVIADNQQIVADFKNGNERALQALVGQVMKASKGQANPPLVNAILKQKLET